jgi:hypothetical protein
MRLPNEKFKKLNSKIFIIMIPLILSAYTHLWNIDGFPSIYRDEDHYMRKAMHVLRGLGPQEGPTELLSYPQTTYTHPYFGQLFLASVLGSFGYPDSLNPTTTFTSIKEVFMVPRLLMGLLAILDTFLLFKIAERRYNMTIGLITSVLFAVMPLTWIIRRIWLEPIQLPFILASILLALYITNPNLTEKRKSIPIVLLSGTLLGLAIFTKIPVVSLIPLVGLMIYSNSKNFKLIGLWIIPVLLIPLLWPMYAISQGELNEWIASMYWQVERQNTGLYFSIEKLFNIDPILVGFSFIGLAYAMVRKRDLFLILWFVPFIMFQLVSSYLQYWHLIPIYPALCIGCAILITDVSKIFRSQRIKKLLPYSLLTIISVYGIIVTTILISLNLTSFHYEVISVLGNEIQKANKITTESSSYNNKDNNIHGVTVLGNNYFLWFPKYILDKNGINEYKNYYHHGDIKTNKIVLAVGDDFIDEITRYNRSSINIDELSVLLYRSNFTSRIEENQSAVPHRNIYPFNSLIDLDPIATTSVEIRTNLAHDVTKHPNR